MFLNVVATVGHWVGDTEYSLLFDENPLADYVELPQNTATSGLKYSNILCGVIRGALESVRACGRQCAIRLAARSRSRPDSLFSFF